MARARILVLALTVLLLAGWGAGALSPAWQAPDLQAVRDVAAQRGAVLNAVAHALSWVGSSVLIAPLAAACCVGLYAVSGRSAAAKVAVSTAGAAVIFNVDKLLVGRSRPPVHHLEEVSRSSFPSGHATLAAAFYVALVIVFISRRPPRASAMVAITATALMIMAISFSRVYLGVHYPSDVIAGVLLGSAWTLLVAWRWREPSPARR